MSAAIKQQAAHSACEFFVKHPIFERSQTIACYLALEDELNTQAIIEAIWDAGKSCYLPVVMEGGELEFAYCDRETELTVNKYNIYEPVGSERIEAGELDLVLMPLVGFDGEGRRLGAGGGYYDRTFGGMKTKPILVGVGFDAQQVDEVPADKWDVRLDGVLTETGLRHHPAG